MSTKRDKATKTQQFYRLSSNEKSSEWACGEVIVERAATVMIDPVGEFTFMCTPTDIDAMAVGFAYTEGIINSMDDIVAIRHNDQQPDFVGIQVDDPSCAVVRRNMIVASSCGFCGVRTIERTLQESAPVGFGLSISHELLLQMPDRLSNTQRIYRATRAAHAAGIFSDRGELVAVAEDIGRHNALDKAIGKCLLNGLSPRGLGVVLSSRASFEMVSKAVRAGIEIVLASAAASALAIQAAHQWNMTLCGPVRDDYAFVYTHPQRIIENGRSIPANNG